MAAILVNTALGADAQAPKGKLVYCSYSNRATAGRGENYCEIINENGQTKVVSVCNIDCRFAEPSEQEFTATEEDAETLRKIILDNKMYELDGYYVEEPMTGGTTYRVFMEFESGEKIVFSWYAHKVKPEAVAAYCSIENFFASFLKKARNKQKQDKSMTSFYYNNTIAMYQYAGDSYAAKKTDDGKALITIDAQYPFSKTMEAESNVFEELQKLVEKHKMHTYKGNYQPSMPVLDGSSWKLGVDYSDDSKIRTSGSNAGPKNSHEAFKDISQFFESFRKKL